MRDVRDRANCPQVVDLIGIKPELLQDLIRVLTQFRSNTGSDFGLFL